MNSKRAWRRGMSIAYVTVAMTATLAFASLAVDYGRAQMAKTQLRVAADAAARAAASAMSDGIASARTVATNIAKANKADGVDVVLDPNNDVQFGTWDYDARTFTVLSGFAQSDANAVRVIARRTAARGNPLQLTFAPFIGRGTCDVSAESIVTIESSGPGIVGLDYINLSEKKTNSYKSKNGTNPSSFSNRGSIFSNGNITLKSGVVVNGDARPGISKKVFTDASCYVTGIKDPLTFVLVYPMPTAGSYATVNDNAELGSNLTRQGDFRLTSGTVNLTKTNYYVRDFTISGPAKVNFQSPVTIWVTGSVSCAGGITTAGNLPANLKIRLVNSGTSATFSGSTAIYTDLYGPASSLTITGNADFYGRIIAKSIDVTGSGELHYDESAVPTAGGLALVK